MQSMESLDTRLGPQPGTNVTICDEEIATKKSENVVSEDQSVPGRTLPSNSISYEKFEAMVNPAIVRNQDGDGCPGSVQCSESCNESMLPMQLTPEIVNSVSNVTELSPVKSLSADENSDIALKSTVVTVDNFSDSQLHETDCSDDHKVHGEAPVILQDPLKHTALQESRILSLMSVDKSPVLPSDSSQEVNNLSHERNTSSQETVTTLEESSILLQKAVDSLQESSVSAQEASVSSQSNSVSSRESSVASPEIPVSSQETSASSQGTSICKQETDLDKNIVKEKLLSYGLDLVCDNDSEEMLFEDPAVVKPSGLADLNSSRVTPVSTKHKKRKKTSKKFSSSGDKIPVTSSSKPEWFKPFEEGWRREVVLRKEAVTSGVRPADIYYYAPSGKKLRSMPEICQHLKDNKYLLDMNCFTFSKCAIYKEPFETVRSAGEHGGKSAKSSPVQHSAQALKRSPSSSLTQVKKKLKTVVASSSTEDIQKKDLTDLPRKRPVPVEDSPKNGSEEGLQPKRSKLVEKNIPQEVGQKLCGLNCLGSEGIPPTIPCDNCMCMFHSTCIRFSATSTSFTCQTCKMQQKTSADVVMVPSSAPFGIPSLRPIALHPTTKQRPNTSGIRGPPPLQRANVSSRAPLPLVVAPAPVPPLILPRHLVKPLCVTTTTYQPLNSTVTTNPASGVHIGSIASGGNLVQSSAVSSQPTRQLRLLLPPKVVTQLNLEKPLALKINGQQLLLQPNEFIPIANGIRVLLPENLIAKSAMIVDSVNKSFTGTSRPNKSKTHGSADDTNEVCIIEPDPSPPPSGSTKSLDVSSTTLKMPILSETLSGKSLTEQLSVTKQTSGEVSEKCLEVSEKCLEVSEKCLSPDVVSSDVQSLGTGEEIARKTTQQMSVAQPPSNMVGPNSDVAESFSESHPVVIHVDSDSDLDSESTLSCEPTTGDSHQGVSSACSCGFEPTYVVVPDSPALLDTTSATSSCQPVSSCGKSSVLLAVLGTTLATQPLLSSCVLSSATSMVSSTLPLCSDNGCSVSEISEKLSVTESVSVQTVEHLTSEPSANHSKDVTDSGVRNDKSSELVNSVIDRQVTSVDSKRCTELKHAWSNFRMLHAGFNTMFQIFQHLGICDLLRAATVCKTWHKLSKDPELWRNISFRGCRVKNWHRATAHFHKMNTLRLDFRGMLQNGSGSCTWLGIAENLPRLSALQHIDFGQCSAKVLSVAAEALPNLQSVTAEIVALESSNSQSGSSCPAFDLAKLANLRELVCLKVRGVHGIVLPANSDTEALQNLSHLSKLQNLSLTTLRGIEGKDLSFIGSLSGLQVLELGNCLNWTKETFGNLAKLVNLINLRLECGGDPVDAGLGDALKKMTNLQHLELIRYFVADNLAIVFPALTHLRTFFIWPELQENEVQVGRQNSIILSAVSGMPFLQRLFWGITLDPRSMTDVSNAANRQATVPFLLRGSPSSVGQSDQRVLSTRLLTIKEIVSALGDRLPNTEIRVFQFPAQSHQINT